MTVRISSRDRKVAELIRDRAPFKTYGALYGEAVNTPDKRLTYWQAGQLAGADLEAFQAEHKLAQYVVVSYSTPIAWWGEEIGWHKVAQKFSPTTSKHQGKLYLIDTPRTTVTSTVFCDDEDCKGHRTQRVIEGRIVLTDDPALPFAVER